MGPTMIHTQDISTNTLSHPRSGGNELKDIIRVKEEQERRAAENKKKSRLSLGTEVYVCA